MLMLSKEMTDQVCKSLLFSFQCHASGGVGQTNHQNFFCEVSPQGRDFDHM